MKHIVYLSLDGLCEPLGQSQVYSYIERLQYSHSVTVISFEKEGFEQDSSFSKIERSLDNWIPLNYASGNSRNWGSLIRLLRILLVLRLKNRISLLHCRGYIMASYGYLFSFLGVDYIFDFRGFWIDEKIHSNSLGIFKNAQTLLRYWESRLFKKSNHIISLTVSARDYIVDTFDISEKRIVVIPTCVNPSHFMVSERYRLEVRSRLNISKEDRVLLFSGSLGGYYSIPEIVKFYKLFRFHYNYSTKFIILTRQNSSWLERELKVEGLEVDELNILKVDHTDVYKYLNCADLGLILYSNDLSSVARSPTKLAEYLLCGLPFAAPNLGDNLAILSESNLSKLVYEYGNRESYGNVIKALDSIQGDISNADSIANYFSLSRAVDKISRLYR